MRFTSTFALLNFVSTCFAEILLPNPGGPYQVSLNISELVDTTRQDPYNATHLRRIMVSRWDPVPPNQCYRNEKTPYMTPKTAAAEDEILEFYIQPAQWPKGVLANFSMIQCFQPPWIIPPYGWDPHTVIFSGGLNTTRLFYNAVAREVASYGYRVYMLGHPYETDFVEFPDGTIITGGAVDKNDNETILKALGVRMNDVSFVLNYLGFDYEQGTPKAVMFGHSFGGAAAASAMMNDTRLRGGINFDGTMFGGVINAGLGRPGINQSFILWGSEGHDTSNDESWGKFYSVLEQEDQWRRELSVNGSGHGSYWDMPLLLDLAGIRDQVPEEAVDAGSVPGARIMDIIGHYLNDFFKFVLKNAGEGLLSGPSKAFPEVLFLRY